VRFGPDLDIVKRTQTLDVSCSARNVSDRAQGWMWRRRLVRFHVHFAAL